MEGALGTTARTALQFAANPVEAGRRMIPLLQKLQTGVQAARICDGTCRQIVMLARESGEILFDLMSMTRVYPDECEHLKRALEETLWNTIEELRSAVFDIYAYILLDPLNRMLKATAAQPAM